MRVVALAALAALCLSSASLAAEKNPNGTITFSWNEPTSPEAEQVAERFRVAGDHNAKLLSQLSPTLIRRTALDETGPQKANRTHKSDALQAIVFKDYGDGMWNVWGPMGIREARAHQASDPSVEVYVEGTDEYEDTLIVYWPYDRDPPPPSLAREFGEPMKPADVAQTSSSLIVKQ